MIWRADIEEEWRPVRGEGRACWLRLRERYLSQRFDPPFTEDDFRMEPLPPVSPAAVLFNPQPSLSGATSVPGGGPAFLPLAAP